MKRTSRNGVIATRRGISMSIEAMNLALEALETLTDCYDDNAVGIEIDAIIALRQAIQEEALRNVARLGQEIEQEPVAWVKTHTGGVSYDLYHDVARQLPEGVEFDLYTHPPKRERVVFPTMLRKMWSGGEVQAWLDENVNKGEA